MMRSVLFMLLLAAASNALPLPAHLQPPLQGFKPVQSHVAAGREVLADVTFHASQPTDGRVWITVRGNQSAVLAEPLSNRELSLCHFASSCPLPAGTHTIRIPALLPRASAPGSYVISISSHQPSTSSPPPAFSFAARVHETLRVAGCAPCGTVLAYTRNGTPSTCCAHRAAAPHASCNAMLRRSFFQRRRPRHWQQVSPLRRCLAPKAKLIRRLQLQRLVNMGPSVRIPPLPSHI